MHLPPGSSLHIVLRKEEVDRARQSTGHLHKSGLHAGQKVGPSQGRSLVQQVNNPPSGNTAGFPVLRPEFFFKQSDSLFPLPTRRPLFSKTEGCEGLNRRISVLLCELLELFFSAPPPMPPLPPVRFCPPRK